MLTIVMYHYVRDLRRTRYKDIKGLDIELFKEQIQFFQKYYTIVTMEEVIEAFDSNYSLPKNALLLTFDDGYSDHYNYVFPILDKYHIQGSFFPSAKPILENKVLDTNKIHFILASVQDKQRIIADINMCLSRYREIYKLEDNSYYYNKYASASRYDTAEVIFIKRLLQMGIPEELRNIITQLLFSKYVTSDEESFSRELYMDLEQIQCMKRNGMFFGSHSYEHYWMNKIDVAEQALQVDMSLSFLADIGCDINNWVMCYPFGEYNESLIEVIKRKGCKLGITTDVNTVIIDPNKRFTLSRLDTNDLPKDKNAEPNQWYNRNKL